MKVFLLIFFPLLLKVGAESPGAGASLFNGVDFTGWTAENPHEHVKHLGNSAKLAEVKAEEQRVFSTHWQVKDGVIYNDGQGPYLKTEKEYGDIELELKFRLYAKSDSGVYLRGCPQVQIWDTREEAGYHRFQADKGSGGLWNNKKEGRIPLVHADKPIGEWNHLKIRQIKEITSVWLNGQLVVDKAVMENYWDRSKPLPEKGPIYLQTHGAPIEWKEIFIKELPTQGES